MSGRPTISLTCHLAKYAEGSTLVDSLGVTTTNSTVPRLLLSFMRQENRCPCSVHATLPG